MRVIAGTAKGTKLISPQGGDTRPTTDRIKEDVFNIIAPYVGGARFLDLFAGSGAIGIEALSRGAAFCAFVDNDKKSASLIKTNLLKTRLTSYSICCENVLSAVKTDGGPFDIIYMDPPYERGLVAKTIEAVERAGILSETGIVVAEASPGEAFAGCAAFETIKSKKYRATVIYVLRQIKNEKG